jgi:hypothetical protein
MLAMLNRLTAAGFQVRIWHVSVSAPGVMRFVVTCPHGFSASQDTTGLAEHEHGAAWAAYYLEGLANAINEHRSKYGRTKIAF